MKLLMTYGNHEIYLGNLKYTKRQDSTCLWISDSSNEKMLSQHTGLDYLYMPLLIY